MSDTPNRTLDEILGPAPQRSLDDILGPAPEKMTEPLSGMAWDAIASGDNPIGRTLNAFGQGFKQGWGAQPYTVAPETEEFLRKAGVWNEQQDAHATFMKTLNEAVMRPAAFMLNIGERAISGLYRGIGEVSPEAGAAIEAFPGGHFTGFPARLPLPAALNEARSLKVIGEGEAGWKGTVEPTPTTEAATADAVKAAVAEAKAAEPPSSAPPTAEPVDLHDLARQIAPDVFAEYDELTTRRLVLSRQIDDLAEMRDRGTSPAIEALDRSINNLRAGRLEAPQGERAAIANRITELEDERAKLVDALPKTGDTPEMAAARQARLEADYRMRDLAPNISGAYRQAGELGAAPETTPPVAAEPPAEVPPPQAEAALPPETSGAVPAEQPAPVDIKADVSQKLVAAGRPAEEADAAASLVEAYYETRAARFAGAKGSASDLYAAEGADIERGGGGGRAGMAGRTVLQDGRATIALFGRADASTFIHETGHQWLDQLARDAEDAQAPESLRNDVSAVRKWLGADETGDLTTRQHEKFARGFERYMMEGHAPSEALASVFGKFKEWLTAIYQTVSRLRAPITDDIRQVFDRMLATEGQKPVVAAEREAPRVIADTHEALVESTPPEGAAIAADKVRSEIETETAKRPEVADELSGRGPGGEVGGGPAEGEPTDRNATPPEPVAGTAPIPGEPGAVEPRGGGAAAQSVGVLERPAAAGARADPTTPDANTSTGSNAEHQFGRSESTLVDKAGNIRLDNLNTPEDVNTVLRETAEQNNEFMEARRGVLSDAEVLDLADALGMRPGDLDARRVGQAFNAEEVIAARKLLVQSATAVRDAAAKVADAAADSEAEVLAYAEIKARHRMIQEQVSGVTAEAGRALRAFRAIEGMAEAEEVNKFLLNEATEGKTLYQLRREAKMLNQLKTPSSVSKAVADSVKPGLGEMALELFQNWLISGPVTHTVYAEGNMLLALYKAVPETAVAATIGAVRELATGVERPRVFFGEVGAQLHALFYGQRNGFRAAYDSLLSGQTMPLPGEVAGSATTAFTQRQAIPNFEVGGVPIPLGSVVRAPGERMVAPIHSYFRSIGYAQAMGRLTYRTAMDEIRDGTLAERDFAARVADLTANPTKEMMETARDEASEQTLMGKGGKFTGALSQFVNWAPNLPLLGPTRVFRFIDPFVHVQSQIIGQGVLLRGPLGILAGKIRADLSGINGSLAQDSAIARMAVGTALGTVAGGLALEGLLMPTAPQDPREANFLQMTEGMPHSIRIGEMAYDLQHFGVLGFQMGLAADLFHGASHFGTDPALEVTSLLIHSIAHNFLQEGAMRGPSDLIKALDEPDRYGARYLRNMIASFAVPFSVGESQIARQVDPFAREARTLMDAMIAKVPVWSETLHPMIDIWGNPVPNREFFGVYAQQLQNDPVTQAMKRLQIFPAKVERKIRGVELTDQQYEDLARTAGRMAKQRLDAIVAAPAFQQMPSFVQHELITHTITNAREAARARVMLENPSIWQTATEEKKALIHGATPKEGREMLKQQVPAGATVH